MYKAFLLIFCIISIVGCSNIDLDKLSDDDLQRISENVIVCEDPYIRHGMECCLDSDKNKVCDEDESSSQSEEIIVDNEVNKESQSDDITEIPIMFGYANPSEFDLERGEVVFELKGISFKDHPELTYKKSNEQVIGKDESYLVNFGTLQKDDIIPNEYYIYYTAKLSTVVTIENACYKTTIKKEEPCNVQGERDFTVTDGPLQVEAVEQVYNGEYKTSFKIDLTSDEKITLTSFYSDIIECNIVELSGSVFFCTDYNEEHFDDSEKQIDVTIQYEYKDYTHSSI